MNADIKRYIEENQGTYTQEAIRMNLIQAGHDPAEVDEALRSFRPEREAGVWSRERWRRFTAYVVGLYGLTFLVYSFGFYHLFEGYEGGAVIATIVFLLFLLVAAGVSISLVRRSRRAAVDATGGLALALVIPFIFLVIVAGLCSVWTGAPLRGVVY